jgi:MFS transporter, PAT family, beta-lactamase induction signal transducer AmpG
MADSPSYFALLRNRRLLAVSLLGFSSGLPLALTGTTLQAWMTSEKVDLSVIGLFSLVGAPYALKFLWAPLLDRFAFPSLGMGLGRRRSWIFATQIGLMLAILGLGFVKPAELPVMTALVALIVSFLSASQDIVIDAYRTDVLPLAEMGPGAALHIAGYRIAMLVSGALALYLSDHMSWLLVYSAMALMLIVGLIATLIAPEPAASIAVPRSLKEAIVFPFVEFFKRKGSFEVLAFILLYKIDVVMATALTTPFILGLGFTRTDIAAVTKVFGLIATVGGTLAGGLLMPKLGMKKSLLYFGVFQGVSTLTFYALANAGHSYPLMVASIAVENVCTGMGTAAFAAFLMSICDKRYTATQYALLTSFMALTRVVGGTPTGFMVKAIGWENFFLFCVVIMIPGLLLLTRFDRWQKIQAHAD